MSHWVWHNVWQVSSGGGSAWGDCDYCLNYDARTCCLVFVPIVLALMFFAWLFCQNGGHLAVGLVLVQLVAIIVLGICVFLLCMAVVRCWRRLRQPNKKYSSSNSCSSTTKHSVQEI